MTTHQRPSIDIVLPTVNRGFLIDNREAVTKYGQLVPTLVSRFIGTMPQRNSHDKS